MKCDACEIADARLVEVGDAENVVVMACDEHFDELMDKYHQTDEALDVIEYLFDVLSNIEREIRAGPSDTERGMWDV